MLLSCVDVVMQKSDDIVLLFKRSTNNEFICDFIIDEPVAKVHQVII